MENIDDIQKLLEKSENVSTHVALEKNKFDDLQKMLSKEEQVYSEISRSIKGKNDGQVMFLVDPTNAGDLVVSISRRVIESGVMPVIILTTMNYKSAQKILTKVNLVDKVFLIDTVSKNVSTVTEQERVWFVDSLRNLTQLQIKIVKLIRKEKNIAFIFDAINVLELYHSQSMLLKFVYSVSKLLKKYKVSGYYSLTKKTLSPKMSQFFDNFIELKKIG